MYLFEDHHGLLAVAKSHERLEAAALPGTTENQATFVIDNARSRQHAPCSQNGRTGRARGLLHERAGETSRLRASSINTELNPPHSTCFCLKASYLAGITSSSLGAVLVIVVAARKGVPSTSFTATSKHSSPKRSPSLPVATQRTSKRYSPYAVLKDKTREGSRLVAM